MYIYSHSLSKLIYHVYISFELLCEHLYESTITNSCKQTLVVCKPASSASLAPRVLLWEVYSS